MAGGGAGRGRAARGSGRLQGEPPAGGRGRREGRAWRGAAAGMETCFGWLRGTTRGFTSSQSNFGAAVQDGRAAARSGLGRGARAAGRRGPARGPPSVRGRRAGRAAGGSGAPPRGAEGKCGRGPGGLGDACPRVLPAQAGGAGERGGEGSLRVGAPSSRREKVCRPARGRPRELGAPASRGTPARRRPQNFFETCCVPGGGGRGRRGQVPWAVAVPRGGLSAAWTRRGAERGLRQRCWARVAWLGRGRYRWELRWEPGGRGRAGVPRSRHAAKQACWLLFLCTCNGDLVVTKMRANSDCDTEEEPSPFSYVQMFRLIPCKWVCSQGQAYPCH